MSVATAVLTTLTDTSHIPVCRTHAEDLWFADKPDQVDQAKRMCGGCPLQADCLAGALHRREPWGVWGGELFEGGRIIPRKIPRGRPRKTAVPAVA